MKQKQLYKVKITERLTKMVDVEANDLWEAEKVAEENWRKGEYVLDAECFNDVHFDGTPAMNRLYSRK